MKNTYTYFEGFSRLAAGNICDSKFFPFMCTWTLEVGRRISVGLAATEYLRIIGLAAGPLLADGGNNNVLVWPTTTAVDVLAAEWTLRITGVFSWFTSGVQSSRLWPPPVAWPFVRAKIDGAAVSFGIGRDCTVIGVVFDGFDDCVVTRMILCFGWRHGGGREWLVALVTFADEMMNDGFGCSVGNRPNGIDIRLDIMEAGDCDCDCFCIDGPGFDGGFCDGICLLTALNIWFLTVVGNDLRSGGGGGISVDSCGVAGCFWFCAIAFLARFPWDLLKIDTRFVFFVFLELSFRFKMNLSTLLLRWIIATHYSNALRSVAEPKTVGLASSFNVLVFGKKSDTIKCNPHIRCWSFIIKFCSLYSRRKYNQSLRRDSDLGNLSGAKKNAILASKRPVNYRLNEYRTS